MYKELTALFGKHVDSPEFVAITKKYFPEFKLGKNKDQYKDKATKVVLCFSAMDKFVKDAPISKDSQHYRHFTGFFFGKDESEIPFGLTAKDDEATAIKKAGKPTHHNKKLDGGIIDNVNDLHYHINKDFKIVVSINPDTGKNWGQVLCQMLMEGMPF
jgi:hypothetical protein